MSRSLAAALATVTLVLTVGAASASEKAHREAKAHAHGHGKVNIAVEGERLFLELEAPGADIVGFEHAAKTDAERAEVTTARTVLESVANIIELPAAAGCKSTSSSVEVHRDGDHSEFQVSYQFQCTATSKLAQVKFLYFEAFKRAEELEVSIISDKGARKIEASRKEPVVQLGSLL